MKKIFIILFSSLLFLIPLTHVSANMAAPSLESISSNVSFEKNESLKVNYETLNISVQPGNTYAYISAIYEMENITNDSVITKSMFIAPNFIENNVTVLDNDEELEYVTKSYYLYSSEDISTDGFEYKILTEQDDDPYYNYSNVDTVTFELEFSPLEKKIVEVSYLSEVGGYPYRDDDNKIGYIYYYLTPALMWQSFGGIEINLYLQEDLPVLSYSNLEFEKIDSCYYQYKSDTLDYEELSITIKQNSLQSFIGFFKNPYSYLALIVMLPFIAFSLIIISLIVTIIVLKIRKKKKNKVNNNDDIINSKEDEEINANSLEDK